ncbi:hypothetical protein FACS1894139_12390 [Planctomycetales bacterium]|nr:hypothetical protein FACS1894107_05510 [Planctomycetales bacterium]GHS96713.1 hypothetical protein FACS1894108_01810 [Planctomycetales bacterium]GHT06472.1 hypothetical protein FACS1894139_12390 [Planctomycetales bacterium]
MKIINGVWRRRLVWLVILAALIGCFVAAGSVVQTLLTRQRANERTRAERVVHELLAQARRLADDYVGEQLAAREKTANALAAQAAARLGEMQAFLQSAAVSREARAMREQNLTLREKRAGLFALADAQQRLLDEKQLALAALEQQIVTLRDELAAAANPSGQEITPPPPPPPLAENAPATADFAAQLRALTDLAEVPANPQWLEKLLQECSLDFKNLLPPNSGLVIAEVGKQVLLTLGDGEITADEVRQESSLPLILQEFGDSRQLMLTLVLADVNAPALPTPAGMARALAARLQSSGDELRGFVIDEDDAVLATFPENGGVRALLPNDRLWVALPDGRSAAYCQMSFAPAANRDYPWSLGLQIIIPQAGAVERLGDLAATHPLGAVIFALSCLLLLAAFGVAAFLAWSPPTGAPAGENARTETLTPRLDSVRRLQQNHRQNGEASEVLLTAKSRILRDLVSRIRTRQKKNLREYR